MQFPKFGKIFRQKLWALLLISQNVKVM